MIDLYECRQSVNEKEKELTDLRDSLDLPAVSERIEVLNAQTESPEFWSDQQKAQKVLKELKILRQKKGEYDKLKDNLDDILVMFELIDEGEEMDELPDTIEAFGKELEKFKLETLLSGEYDSNNAIISLHPGAGGTESQDWAEMLLRMYTRWAERKGFKVKSLDLQPGDVAGIKSATLLIEGINAYGYLKTERGVHRLVRISPFDSSGRRHTSFASLDVTPEVDDSVEIEINPDDIRVDTYRASGAGGQHVNKTSSAIRITHIPTGVVVQCQNERSQHQNKEVAMNMLKGKLVEIMEQEQKEKLDDVVGDYSQIAWGSQIRSYVFHPYNMVKDHRTNVEVGNIQSVMDGDLDQFMNAYLQQTAAQQ
ncbi:peptide chain release factor 2 [Eubacterium callanderi]|nr:MULTISPECIES: peptide chain release factor 2 [Eubacterium]MDR4073477.1 peptide chain release factor 2 [Eubacterium sp.]MCB6659192.1 peptide chain release factor 2 [Eubacterium callanderi]MCB6752049.1 peptide chain release factor 2 [Eubacterium callanderi]MCB7103444.1 peptide chain release factor 2 [Eubacterium callanderi]MCG4588880.1 peptide chain release factor 2 [Eubacterium callanderi]